MIGDKLKIKDHHRKAAAGVEKILLDKVKASEGKFFITVAGESGAGKSEVAAVLAERLEAQGIKCVILQQDDYFVYPPRTNAGMREKDISHVGTSEVKLDLIDRNLADMEKGAKQIEKPLVIYDEDRITTETINVEDAKVAIVEGTYITMLKKPHQRVFINRTFRETKAARLERAREEQDDYLEKILTIEHEIISKHKALADIIITPDWDTEVNDGN